MSRPPGPPPYTMKDIAELSTPVQKFIAQAELSSYIMGHKMANLRAKSFQASRNSCKTDDAHYRHTLDRPRGDLKPPLDGVSGQFNHNYYQGSATDGSPNAKAPMTSYSRDIGTRAKQQVSVGDSSGPIRTNNSRGAARGRGTRRGAGGYRPYPKRTHVKMAQSWAGGDCLDFMTTGKCARSECADSHFDGRVALCKLQLFKDKCSKKNCHLSHKPNPNNTPHCLYYRDGRCTKSPCAFAHVDLDEDAPVCQAFGRWGYCPHGASCFDLHVYECPNYSNDGSCPYEDRCHLRHIHRASRIKAATSRSSYVGSSRSDVSQKVTTHDTSSHAFSQQHDYVPFDLED